MAKKLPDGNRIQLFNQTTIWIGAVTASWRCAGVPGTNQPRDHDGVALPVTVSEVWRFKQNVIRLTLYGIEI